MLGIGVLTCLAAVLTYLAVGQDSRAAALDRQSILENAQFQGQVIAAETKVHAQAAAAAEYRRGRAEVTLLERRAASTAASGAELSAAALAEQALLERLVVESGASLTFDRNYLRGAGASARYQPERHLATLLAPDPRAVPRTAAPRTAARASRFHLSSERLANWIVVLFAAVVMLTLARLARGLRRTVLAVASALLSTAAALVAVAQWALITLSE